MKLLSKNDNPLRKKIGITIAEILIALSLVGFMSILAINTVLQQPTLNQNRVADDYIKVLAATYRQIQYKTGSDPVLASGGIPDALPTSESIATYTVGPPRYLSYPSGVILYLHPEEILGDPVLTGTNNREWVLLDINGTKGPNAIVPAGATGASGDRVLLYIENTTGRVLTAWQKDSELGGVASFKRSFYDFYKGY